MYCVFYTQYVFCKIQTMSNEPAHVGVFIKAEVFPRGMTVTAAAELLKIGRPALSKVLNGRAKLSSSLAVRIEAAFGFPAKDLMNMQASSKKQKENLNDTVSVPVGSYVPPFLQVRANQIEDWASKYEARFRLSVLLRTLVNSTGSGLTKVDFPGNDDAERKGWDGFVEAEQARPWVPEGASGWEFGCGTDVKRKAEGDFVKRTGAIPYEKRKDITFVFVTPRRWSGKNDWEKEHREEGQWKDVRVFDSSDLEQWMEQSIPAQAWFAEETKIPNEGVFSLEACWKNWGADCEPALVPELFDQSLGEYKQRVLTWLEEKSGRPLAISADSVEEGLAFLHVVFSGDEPALRENADKVVVFKKPDAVSRLVSAAADIMAVSTSPEVERELASHRKSARTVLVYPKNTPNVKPDIDLKSLNPFAFASALKKMSCAWDEIDRLRRESGFSLTVLRRRLSGLPAVRTPGWAGDRKRAESLIAVIFAGTWDATKTVDKFLVSQLAGGRDYEEIEREIRGLLPLDDSPVLSFGSYLGVKSKIDALFAVSESVAGTDIDRFFEVAEIVVQEDDPALDLPDDKRYEAAVLGKSREVSDMLRQSIIDSFVLLAVHGSGLFRERGGFGIEARVREMVKKWFRPSDERSLESRTDALPACAEADPETFLSIIEKDLRSDDPGILSLLRPVEAPAFIAPTPPRVELLWALESLAWSGKYLARVVDVLARLALEEERDNWENSSMRSLGGIFRSWMPQTSVPVDDRIDVFNGFLKKFPDIGWELCVEQVSAGPKSGEYSHKPRWRTDDHGHGGLAQEFENWKFILNAMEKAVGWPRHDEETLAVLVRNLREMPSDLRFEVWRLIEDWCARENTMDEERVRLRETIRVSGCLYPKREITAERAQEVYDMLAPSDVVLRHEWLFLYLSLPPARGEEYASGLEFREYLPKFDEKIEMRRISALSEIYAEEGVGGLTRLARRGEGQRVVGSLILQLDSFDDRAAEKLICSALDEAGGENRHQMENLIRGVLQGLEDPRRENMLRAFLETKPGEVFLRILLLAPFCRKTWKFLNGLKEAEKSRYWREVNPSGRPGDPLELNEAVEELIIAERPFEAASLIPYGIRGLEPESVFRLLEAMGESRNRKRGDYVPDSLFIEKAFGRLDESGTIPADEMVRLEVMFTDSLIRSERGVCNLEDRVAQHPGTFVELVELAFKRDDMKEDAPEDSAQDETWQRLAVNPHELLGALKRLPGRNESGEIVKDRLLKWVGDVRDGCRRSGRLGIGDDRIGTLLSKSPNGKDGIWPAEPVRDALEEFYSEELSRGFQIGLHNAKNSHFGFGGDQEREIEREYREWAKRIQYSHPRTSQILRELADYFSHLATHYDDTASTIFRLNF